MEPSLTAVVAIVDHFISAREQHQNDHKLTISMVEQLIWPKKLVVV